MKRSFASLLGLVGFLTLSGCSSTPQLRMDAQHAPQDDSVIAPALFGVKLKRVMVAPPIGAPLRKYDPLITMIEREFIKEGVTVVSSVALDAGPVDAQRVNSLGRKMDVDAVLQIGEWDWSRDLAPKRFFVYDGENYREVNATEYRTTNAYKVAFPASELHFSGKLIQPTTGEVLATIDVRTATNYNLPSRYVATVLTSGDKPTISAESFPYSSPTWIDEARKQAETSLVRNTADRLLRLSAPDRKMSSTDTKPSAALPPQPLLDSVPPASGTAPRVGPNTTN